MHDPGSCSSQVCNGELMLGARPTDGGADQPRSVSASLGRAVDNLIVLSTYLAEVPKNEQNFVLFFIKLILICWLFYLFSNVEDLILYMF